MKWDQVQQLIRIVMQIIGGAVLGDAVASGELYQGVIGGTVNIAAFIWWFYWERIRAAASEEKSE